MARYVLPVVGLLDCARLCTIIYPVGHDQHVCSPGAGFMSCKLSSIWEAAAPQLTIQPSRLSYYL